MKEKTCLSFLTYTKLFNLPPNRRSVFRWRHEINTSTAYRGVMGLQGQMPSPHVCCTFTFNPGTQTFIQRQKWKSVWKRLWWHTGSATDLINCETYRGVMQLWGRGDYCLPMMLIINLITLHMEKRWGEMSHLDADRCVSESAFGSREKGGRSSALQSACPPRASRCHLGLTSHSSLPCQNLFAEPKWNFRCCG